MIEISQEERFLTRQKRKSIGAFFTPSVQADFMVRNYRIHRQWAEGAVVMDPTAGMGSLLESLIRVCLEEGIPVTQDMMNRLHGVEKERDFTLGYKERLQRTYGLKLRIPPIKVGDILWTENAKKADILFGNPPWLNFTDLPGDEKEALKPHFLKYGLARSAGELLLGNSRIDMAALIIMKTLEINLKEKGNAYFFSPLSLVFNEGAHNIFRRGRVKNRLFSIREIWDYNGFEIFRGVTTRCGLLHIQRDRPMEQRIPYHTMQADAAWKKLQASPIADNGSAYVISDPQRPFLPEIPKIAIRKESVPRQGINTGGRNSLFIFQHCRDLDETLCELSNKDRTVRLPRALIYPLLAADQFRGRPEPKRYIFLPYRNDGTPMSAQELQAHPSAWAYLEENREPLKNRKGVMLRSQIGRGYYWSLLGLGPYTFFPWKIVWESYGKKKFQPLLFSHYRGKAWIPNQALQAYCPFRVRAEAETMLKQLRNPEVNALLQRQNMQGTCNWAQPGRIKVFLKVEE